MFHESFIRRIRSQPYIDADALLKALDEPSPVSIRINPGKWNRIPSDSGPVTWCKTGFYLQSRPSFTLDPLFHSGCYYPREASGMFLEQIFRQVEHPAENLRILDLCGAPGGKSTQLSDHAGLSGLVVANETIRSRAPVLAETLTKWGTGNIVVTQNDPSAFGKFKGYFDIILVDAPCSGEGMFRNRSAVEEWSPENSDLCAIRQKRIINTIWPALKESGILIYSTCTFNPGENEENIRWLIQNQKADCLRLDISPFTGITEIDYHGIYGYGFFPDRVRGEGFFISAVRKTGSQEHEQPMTRKRSGMEPGRNDTALAFRWTGIPEERLLRRGVELTALPCAIEEFMFIFSKLNVLKAGIHVATAMKNDYLPAHELALAQVLKSDAFPKTDISYREAIGFLRRDALSLHGLDAGWNILTFKGVNIGLVKNLGKRINNYFPVEWRIRLDMPRTGNGNIIRWGDEK